MKGIEFAEVRDAIQSAFDADQFDMFLYERLDFNRANQVADGPFALVVAKVLQQAEREGWDPMLIAEVAAVMPLKADVQKIYAKYAQALVDEGRQHAVDAGRQKAIEKYRLGPSVVIQTRGAPRIPAAVPGTEAGLEKAVRPFLPLIDVGLWREHMFKLEGRVCRVEINRQARGTGFLVGPDTVLTNYHVMREVIDNRTLASKVQLRFDYRVLANGTKSDGTVVSLHPTEWLIDSTPYTTAEANNDPDAALPSTDELDFALLKIERVFGSEPLRPATDSSARGWIPVPETVPLITTDPPMPILILQHPNTEPLKLAVDTAGVLKLYDNGTRIRYATNTEPGSSGSPCFNIDWKLIALHHYGDPQHDQAQYNQGVPINMIRDRLRRKGKESSLGGLTN
jgi:hypothetical protein